MLTKQQSTEEMKIYANGEDAAVAMAKAQAGFLHFCEEHGLGPTLASFSVMFQDGDNIGLLVKTGCAGNGDVAEILLEDAQRIVGEVLAQNGLSTPRLESPFHNTGH
jgi:hypothetical protein